MVHYYDIKYLKWPLKWVMADMSAIYWDRMNMLIRNKKTTGLW